MKPISLSSNIQPNTTTISNQFIDSYMAKANGEYIKVFLMILRLLQANVDPLPETIADKLDMTERDVLRALSYWEREGLLSSEQRTDDPQPLSKGNAPAKASAVPEKVSLTPVEMLKKQKDQGFSHLRYITEMYLGHPMTNPEINSLSYIYDRLKLPVELIEYLIEYCVSNHKNSLRYMEKVAIDWHQKGITTLTQAKTQASSYGKDYYTIMKAMGLKNAPAPAQIEFMEKWLHTDGFSLNMVLEACRRTITAIGKPSFPYAGKILEAWKKAGIRSLNELASYEKNTPASKPSVPGTKKAPKLHNFEERSYDFDALEQRYIQKINQ
jgi:DnaD/phage-associated family protein